MLVEILTFQGCPHAESALDLVDRLVAECHIAATVRRVNIPDAEVAVAQRFLGSPTIRVNGRDVEPGADERSDYALSCRVYRTGDGLKGEPDERWLSDALQADA